jgi:hypothetical protein
MSQSTSNACFSQPHEFRDSPHWSSTTRKKVSRRLPEKRAELKRKKRLFVASDPASSAFRAAH